MTLIWTRVDQKLIHGQVSLGWVPYLGINALVVVDADTAADIWAQKVMMMGLPPDIETTGFTQPDQLLELLGEEPFLSRRVMAIFKNLEGVLEALAAGLRLERLNLGNQVCCDPGRDICLGETFYVCSRALDNLAEYQKAGLEVLIQALPNGRATRWRPGPRPVQDP